MTYIRETVVGRTPKINKVFGITSRIVIFLDIVRVIIGGLVWNLKHQEKPDIFVLTQLNDMRRLFIKLQNTVRNDRHEIDKLHV